MVPLIRQEAGREHAGVWGWAGAESGVQDGGKLALLEARRGHSETGGQVESVGCTLVEKWTCSCPVFPFSQ